MSVRRAKAHATLIARTELRRRLRAVGNDPKRLLALLFGGTFALLALAASIGGAYFLGHAFRTGTVDFDALGVGRSVVSFVFTIFTFLVGMRFGQKREVLDNPECVLVAIDHREATAGAVLAELVGGVGVFIFAAVGAGTAFAAGIGRLLPVVFVTVGLLLPALLGSFAGFAVGIGARLAVSRVAIIARFKTVLGVVFVLFYFSVLFRSSPNTAFQPVLTAFATTPIGWFAHLALLGVAPAAETTYAAAAVTIAALGIPALFVLTTRLTAELWFGDAVTTGRDEREASATQRSGTVAGLTRLGGAGDGVVSRPTLRVVERSWLRARRAPITLSYVLYPVFFLYVPVRQVLAGGASVSVAASLAMYVAWAAGAAFSLNPLGDEGAVLPSTLTTGITGRQFVGGACLAGAVAGGPVAAAAAGVVAVLADASPAVVAALVAFGGVLGVATTGLAAGAGTAFPKFETTRISRSRRAVLPGLPAFALYSIGVLVVATPGAAVAVGFVRRALSNLLGFAPTTVVVVGVVFSALLAGVVGTASGAYAARRFDTYEV